jgi:hypothetical protein
VAISAGHGHHTSLGCNWDAAVAVIIIPRSLFLFLSLTLQEGFDNKFLSHIWFIAAPED